MYKIITVSFLLYLCTRILRIPTGGATLHEAAV